MKNGYLLILFFYGLFHSALFAQTKSKKRITATFNDSRFEQFVKEAEPKQGVIFTMRLRF